MTWKSTSQIEKLQQQAEDNGTSQHIVISDAFNESLCDLHLETRRKLAQSERSAAKVIVWSTPIS